MLAILSDAEKNGKHLMVFETLRSPTRQAALYAAGATKLKTVGVHAYGLAADIVYDVHGEPSWKGDFGFLGHLAKAHGLIWGGDWGHPEKPHKFVDSCHVQWVSVEDQPKLFSGKWYPDASYKP